MKNEKLPDNLMTNKELKEFQKELSNLPEPSFNNQDKAQQTVIPSVVVPLSVQMSTIDINAEDKQEKPFEQQIILTKPAPKIEQVASIKKQPKFSILKRIFSYTKRYWGLFLITILFALINSVFEVLTPFYIGKAVDCIIGVDNVYFDLILHYIVLIIVCLLGFAVFKWLMSKVANTIAYKVEKNLRVDMFRKFNNVPLKYIDNSSHGDLQSRMVNDVDHLTDGFVTGITTVCDCLASIVLTVYFMFSLNFIMALVIIFITPLSIISSTYIAKKSYKLVTRQAKSIGDLSGHLVELVGNQKIVKAFQYEERSKASFNKINKELQESSEKALLFSTMAAPIARFINGILYAIVAIMGTIFAIKGKISIGAISVFLAYTNKYTQPFNQISDAFADMQYAFASAVRIFNILDMENESSDIGLDEIKINNGRVEINNVNFSYSKQPLIENLNLIVDKGQKVAIVGPTGCGKSTLINLLMRFYDVNSGEIKICDKPITSITRASLRNQFGMVLQDSWLFSDTIKANISYGKKDATDTEIKNVAKLVGVDYFISTMENGYDTVINENGDNLSQGQKQLICIARLLLTRPPMLILDEATSNIDTRTELQIQSAFNHIMIGKTSFVVAHRLSTIVTSDIILVMNKGAIVEQGTHAELLKKQGYYYTLYNSQFSNT